LQVAGSLWLLKDETGLDDLVAWAISKYPDDLILATLALAAPKDQRVMQHVRANLVTDYPEVDLAAARALGELGSDEGYTVATNGAASKDGRQRFLAALALGAIGRSDAQPILANLLKDESGEVRIGAAKAILELHNATAAGNS
jgi:HEAT repeat protein